MLRVEACSGHLPPAHRMGVSEAKQEANDALLAKLRDALDLQLFEGLQTTGSWVYLHELCEVRPR